MCAVDHGHIIRAVTDGERDGRRVGLANQLHKPPLLHWAQTAADARPTGETQIVNELSHLGGFQRISDCGAVEHEARVRGLCQLRLRILQQLERLCLALSQSRVRQRRVVVEEARRPRDVHRGLNLVAREYPHANACVLEGRDGLRHAILQSVFHGGNANERELSLHLRRDTGDVGFLRFVEHAVRCHEPGSPRGVVGLVDLLPSEKQRSQALFRELTQLAPHIIGHCSFEQIHDDTVGSLR
mmetsp:Transcript_26340/g.69245  ORF Transcript_26340/g.69245 Transcript_26340/m.69245 type:complete len:242 (-) Transcript_26340:1797-2522(-)